MKANDKLRVSSFWTMPNNANGKMCRARFGPAFGSAAPFLGATLTTSLTLIDMRYLHANNSTGAQKGAPSANPQGGFGATASATVTLSADTTQANSIFFSGQLGSGSDTLTLEAYTVEYIPGA